MIERRRHGRARAEHRALVYALGRSGSRLFQFQSRSSGRHADGEAEGFTDFPTVTRQMAPHSTKSEAASRALPWTRVTAGVTGGKQVRAEQAIQMSLQEKRGEKKDVRSHAFSSLPTNDSFLCYGTNSFYTPGIHKISSSGVSIAEILLLWIEFICLA